MAITLNGSGSITGLSSGAGISASALSGVLPDANAPSGSVIQVVSATKTDGFTTTSGTLVDITGFSATITPTSTSSKILIISNFVVGTTNDYPYPKLRIRRNGSDIYIGDAVGSSSRLSTTMYTGATSDIQGVSASINYLDSPNSTSALTYNWLVSVYASRPVYIGRSGGSADGNAWTAPSTITLMEIAA
jgi:hypothetical protein